MGLVERMVKQLTFSSTIMCTQHDLWNFHSDASALQLLAPPGQKVTFLSEDTAVHNGAMHKLKVTRFGVSLIWLAEISEVEPESKFVDTARKSPFKFWRHTHEFLDVGDGIAELRDTVEYELPLGILGRLFDKLVVEADVRRMFAHRHLATKKALEK